MTSGYHVAPYAPDGELLGVTFWPYSQFTERWLNSCREFLTTHGANFTAQWPKNLRHVSTKLTSDAGTGLVTFYIDGVTVMSGLFLSGLNPTSEAEVTTLFVDSLKRTARQGFGAGSTEAFGSVEALPQRPVAVLVAWPIETIPDEQYGLVEELILNLAATFFQQQGFQAA